MDENRPAYELQAPAASSTPVMRLPARNAAPRVDDHLVTPELSRDEVIGGVRYEASPSDAPHGIQNSEVDYVVRAHVAEGYKVANDLLTRFDVESDFASDTAVLKGGTDPETGSRYLEELSFEVVSEQNAAMIAKKVPRMLRRGVRRVFAIFVKEGEVREWSAGLGSWTVLDPGSSIEDRCLSQPLVVAALLDAIEADNAVARALEARENPEIRRLKAEAKAGAVLSVLKARQIPTGDAVRSRILGCTDLNKLDQWLANAVFASSAERVFDCG